MGKTIISIIQSSPYLLVISIFTSPRHEWFMTLFNPHYHDIRCPIGWRCPEIGVPGPWVPSNHPSRGDFPLYRARILSVPLGSFAQPRRSQLKSHVGQLYKQKGFEKPCAETMGRLPTKICSTLCAYSPSS